MTKISAVIPNDLAAVLKERAKAEDRSVGAVVRIAIAEHVGNGTDREPDSARPPKDGNNP